MIDIKNLTYVYGENTPFQKTALDNINLHIKADSIVGIIGHTGCGKSTLVSHLNGILKPKQGEITVDGVKLWDKSINMRQIRFKVGLVFQYPEYQLFEETVAKDIAYGVKNMGLSQEEINQRVAMSADLCNITPEIMGKSPFDLSGGQKRRVAIAGIIAMQPKVLVLDEPASGLDPKGREEILGMISEYRKRTHSTVLLVSHSMEDVARFADKLIVMDKGKILCYDDTPKVFSRYADKMEEIGLDIPQVTKIMGAVEGKNVPVFTVEQAVDEIVKLINNS